MGGGDNPLAGMAAGLQPMTKQQRDAFTAALGSDPAGPQGSSSRNNFGNAGQNKSPQKNQSPQRNQPGGAIAKSLAGLGGFEKDLAGIASGLEKMERMTAALETKNEASRQEVALEGRNNLATRAELERKGVSVG